MWRCTACRCQHFARRASWRPAARRAERALATASVYEWQPVGANQHGRVGTECPPSKSTAELAGIAGVGERTIKQAKAVQAKAEPEVIAAVQRGDIGLPKAAAIAQMPRAEQAAAISQPLPKAPAPAACGLLLWWGACAGYTAGNPVPVATQWLHGPRKAQGVSAL